MSEFKYILEKIDTAEFENEPFRHLHIKDLLSDEHFSKVIGDTQVHFESLETTKDVIDKLIASGYKIKSFPGCVSDAKSYMRQLENNQWIDQLHGNPISSAGLTFRLYEFKNEFTYKLLTFLNSNEVHDCLRNKFEITERTDIVSAIQKNLSYYEISPHPDIRRKALTYLLNINNTSAFDSSGQHTHLLKFIDKYEYIYKHWENNTESERCWVPWSWCTTEKQHSENNSIILFEPSNDTLHAVKLNYDHTELQRTQIYGNLMYPDRERKKFDKGTYRHLESLMPNREE